MSHTLEIVLGVFFGLLLARLLPVFLLLGLELFMWFEDRRWRRNQRKRQP